MAARSHECMAGVDRMDIERRQGQGLLETRLASISALAIRQNGQSRMVRLPCESASAPESRPEPQDLAILITLS